ncbi:MAG: aminopeptidase P family protein [Rhodobacterales bacterium]
METTQTPRPEFFTYPAAEKAPLPFSQAEYDQRIAGLRKIMQDQGLNAVVLTSMHNIAYYSGFLYCSFGRPYGCVVTEDRTFTVSAAIDAAQPARRSACENITFTDWKRDNYWRAVKSCLNGAKSIGIEGDHLTLLAQQKLQEFLTPEKITDIAPATMLQRMIKSPAEIALIKQGARIADIGGFAIRDAIKIGTREIDVAMAGRDAMELEIAKTFPDSEYRDTWVWFQSGLNTDGAHNPVTSRRLQAGDILSLNAFPMINGYYTALERTLFVGEPNQAQMRVWQANVEAHELGLTLIKQGATCSGICAEINAYFEQQNLLQYRSFGYGHSFGILSHYYGREAGLELREDIDTALTPGMVVSMEPMVTVPAGDAAAGGYREHDIVVITDEGEENITKFPYGPEHNIVAA